MGEEGGGAGRLLGLEPGGDGGASFLSSKGRVSRRPVHTGSGPRLRWVGARGRDKGYQ